MQTNNINLEDINFNDDHDIRGPDPVITETLIDDTNYLNNDNNNNDNDFDRIMKLSIEEFELNEEKKIQEMIVNNRYENVKKYNDIKQRLQKVKSYDTINKDIYSTIISIIELYEANFIDTYVLDETSYNNIFALLKTIRLTKEELDLLHALIK